MKEMCIIHNSYDRICDKVMYLGSNTFLMFNIDLCYKSSRGDRVNYHREVSYMRDDIVRVKINREFYYYYSIDYSSKDGKISFRIGINELYPLIYNLGIALKWLMGNDGVSVFGKRNGKLFVANKVNPLRIYISFDNYIELEPAVGINSNGYECVGIKMFLNSDTVFTFIEANTVYGLNQLLTTGNMYMMAQNMLSYMGRPDNGTNLFDMNTGTVSGNDGLGYINNSSSNNQSRRSKSKDSFFTKVGATKL